MRRRKRFNPGGLPIIGGFGARTLSRVAVTAVLAAATAGVVFGGSASAQADARETGAEGSGEAAAVVLYLDAPALSVERAERAARVAERTAASAGEKLPAGLAYVTGETVTDPKIRKALASITDSPDEPGTLTAEAAQEAGGIYLAQSGGDENESTGPGEEQEVASAGSEEPVRPELGDGTKAPARQDPADPGTGSETGQETAPEPRAADEGSPQPPADSGNPSGDDGLYAYGTPETPSSTTSGSRDGASSEDGSPQNAGPVQEEDGSQSPDGPKNSGEENRQPGTNPESDQQPATGESEETKDSVELVAATTGDEPSTAGETPDDESTEESTTEEPGDGKENGEPVQEATDTATPDTKTAANSSPQGPDLGPVGESRQVPSTLAGENETTGDVPPEDTTTEEPPTEDSRNELPTPAAEGNTREQAPQEGRVTEADTGPTDEGSTQESATPAPAAPAPSTDERSGTPPGETRPPRETLQNESPLPDAGRPLAPGGPVEVSTEENGTSNETPVIEIRVAPPAGGTGAPEATQSTPQPPTEPLAPVDRGTAPEPPDTSAPQPTGNLPRIPDAAEESPVPQPVPDRRLPETPDIPAANLPEAGRNPSEVTSTVSEQPEVTVTAEPAGDDSDLREQAGTRDVPTPPAPRKTDATTGAAQAADDGVMEIVVVEPPENTSGENASGETATEEVEETPSTDNSTRQAPDTLRPTTERTAEGQSATRVPADRTSAEQQSAEEPASGEPQPPDDPAPSPEGKTIPVTRPEELPTPAVPGPRSNTEPDPPVGRQYALENGEQVQQSTPDPDDGVPRPALEEGYTEEAGGLANGQRGTREAPGGNEKAAIEIVALPLEEGPTDEEPAAGTTEVPPGRNESTAAAQPPAGTPDAGTGEDQRAIAEAPAVPDGYSGLPDGPDETERTQTPAGEDPATGTPDRSPQEERNEEAGQRVLQDQTSDASGRGSLANPDVPAPGGSVPSDAQVQSDPQPEISAEPPEPPVGQGEALEPEAPLRPEDPGTTGRLTTDMPEATAVADTGTDVAEPTDPDGQTAGEMAGGEGLNGLATFAEAGSPTTERLPNEEVEQDPTSQPQQETSPQDGSEDTSSKDAAGRPATTGGPTMDGQAATGHTPGSEESEGLRDTETPVADSVQSAGPDQAGQDTTTTVDERPAAYGEPPKSLAATPTGSSTAGHTKQQTAQTPKESYDSRQTISQTEEVQLPGERELSTENRDALAGQVRDSFPDAAVEMPEEAPAQNAIPSLRPLPANTEPATSTEDGSPGEEPGSDELLSGQPATGQGDSGEQTGIREAPKPDESQQTVQQTQLGNGIQAAIQVQQDNGSSDGTPDAAAYAEPSSDAMPDKAAYPNPEPAPETTSVAQDGTTNVATGEIPAPPATGTATQQLPVETTPGELLQDEISGSRQSTGQAVTSMENGQGLQQSQPSTTGEQTARQHYQDERNAEQLARQVEPGTKDSTTNTPAASAATVPPAQPDSREPDSREPDSPEPGQSSEKVITPLSGPDPSAESASGEEVHVPPAAEEGLGSPGYSVPQEPGEDRPVTDNGQGSEAAVKDGTRQPASKDKSPQPQVPASRHTPEEAAMPYGLEMVEEKLPPQPHAQAQEPQENPTAEQGAARELVPGKQESPQHPPSPREEAREPVPPATDDQRGGAGG